MFDPFGPMPDSWPEQRLFIGKINHVGAENLKIQIAKQPRVAGFHYAVTAILERTQEENYALGLADRTPIPNAAWSLRNLSELRIWLRFMLNSKHNLERFTNDYLTTGVSNLKAAMRLVDDLGKRVPNPAKRTPEQYQYLAEMKAARSEAQLADALPLMAKTYATGVKLEKEYTAISALTSPLIHPSAISVLRPLDIESYRQTLEGLGIVLASEIVIDAREHIDKYGYATRDGSVNRQAADE